MLLAAIALGPLFFSRWWNQHYAKAAFGLGAIVVAYYFIGLHAPGRVWSTAHEYVSFIALIGSLYVVSGGIHINVKGEATPLVNTFFLLIGAVLANILGTTGASMLLIRPWLRMNKYRVTGHHVVFFIFVVSNVGGCLTPIGDPPLFLGYLMGVPFWWVWRNCLPMWATGIGILLILFFAVDYRNFLRAPRQVRAELAGPHGQWRFEGAGNVLFLLVILAAVFLHEPVFLREGLMAAAALGSYFLTRKSVHEANHFNFHPINEVVVLFIGIFATMMPALDWLQLNAGKIEAANSSFFYWGSGILSGVLDNAPTYLCFFKTIFGRFVDPHAVAQVNDLIQSHGANLAGVPEDIRQTFLALQQYHPADLASGKIGADQIEVAYLLGHAQLNRHVAAISVGAVFFGAGTYIGNGPNFMVKSIASHSKIHTPSFISYVLNYTLPYLLPMLLVVWWFFFRH